MGVIRPLRSNSGRTTAHPRKMNADTAGLLKMRLSCMVPAAALSEAWKQIRHHCPGSVDQMQDLLASPMILVDPLDDTNAAQAGELVRVAT